MENYIKTNLDVDITFIRDTHGNIIDVNAKYIISVPETQDEYCRSTRIDSFGRETLIYEMNVT